MGVKIQRNMWGGATLRIASPVFSAAETGLSRPDHDISLKNTPKHKIILDVLFTTGAPNACSRRVLQPQANVSAPLPASAVDPVFRLVFPFQATPGPICSGPENMCYNALKWRGQRGGGREEHRFSPGGDDDDEGDDLSAFHH